MMISKTESTLLSMAMALIVLAVYQLWQPINYHANNQQVLGELEFLENSAKLKISGDLIWRDARQGDPVTEGASLFTGDAAQALVHMTVGSSIHLSPNTLIRIQENLKLENGLIHTTLGETPFEIDVSGEKIRLQGEGAQLQLSRVDNQTTLAVIEGEVQVERLEEKYEIKKNEGFELKDKKIKRVEFALELVSPLPSALTWTKNKSDIELKWKSLGEVDLEVATDISFKHIILQEKLDSSSFNYLFEPGQYYWRVKQSQQTSRIGTFLVQREQPIELFAPSDKLEIEIPAADTTFTQLLQWSDTQVKSYKLVYRINEKEFIIVTDQTDYKLNLDGAGLVTWQVKPLDPTRPDALASIEQKFIVLKAQDLIAPYWNQTEIVLSKSRDDQSRDVSFNSKGLEHEWLLTQNGQRIASRRQTSLDLSFPYQDKPGEFDLVVRSFDRYGKASSWSTPLRIQWSPFQERLPIEGQAIQLERPDQKVRFEWAGEGEQFFELSVDESFAKIIISRKAIEQTEIVFPEIGTFYWRVRKLDGSFSHPKKVFVEPSPPLAAPEAPPELKKELKFEVKDMKNSSLWDFIIPRAFANEFEGSLMINLPTNEKAEGYKVEIYANEELEHLIFSHTTSKSEFEWSKARPGRYWYRYALIDAWGRESEMSPASILNVIPGQISPPERAKLIRPIRAQVIKAAPQVAFSWTQSARTQNYTLQISNTKSFKDPQFEYHLSENKKVIETRDFEIGKMYYWKVISRHQYGEVSSSVGRFIYSQAAPPEMKEEIVIKEKHLRPMNAYSFASLSFTPQSITTDINEKEFNAEISGTLFNSMQLDVRYYLKEKWALELKLQNQSGKVFENQNYLSRHLSLAALYSLRGESSFYHFSFGAAQFTSSSYKLETPEKLSGKEESSLGAIVKGEWEKRFQKSDSLHTTIGVHVGDVSDIQMSLYYRRFYKAGYFAHIGLNYQVQSVKTTSGKNDSTLLGLGLGGGLAF